MVDGHALAQVDRYREWLLKNRDRFSEKVASRHRREVAIDWGQVRAIMIGHRYHPSAAKAILHGSESTFLRYGRWDDRTVYIREVDRRELENGVVGEPPPKEGKGHYLQKHLDKTTRAASDAFEALRRRMEMLGFTEEILGKRITYSMGSHRAKVMFTTVGLEVSFKGGSQLEDPEGRARDSDKDDRRCTCGIVTEADVDPVMELLKEAR
jgi:hypothetical protein